MNLLYSMYMHCTRDFLIHHSNPILKLLIHPTGYETKAVLVQIKIIPNKFKNS